MAEFFDCTDETDREHGLAAAELAVKNGRLVVLPTDTVYGVGADAFSATAVTALLAAKNRGRAMPVPVLIGDQGTMAGLTQDVPQSAKDLAAAFWPGGLTLVVEHALSLAWDLGDAEGTVALRVPDDDVARALLRRTGPMAVSSANRSGRPTPATAREAADQLDRHVDVVLDDGPRTGTGASTIVDCTSPAPRVLRVGAVSVERLREIVPELID